MTVIVTSCVFEDLLLGNDLTGRDQSNQKIKITGSLNIPEYQRSYRWTDTQIERLWNDYTEFLGSQVGREGHCYYMGSLILHKTPDGLLNIIDGQQRVTTLGLLAYLNNSKPLDLKYDSPISQQQIFHNLKWIKDKLSAELDKFDPKRINLTLVITQSEDDAYRFFETQNTGGVRLSGPDIIKAHHLRAIEKNHQNIYASKWESLGDLNPTVLTLLRGRYWQRLRSREIPSHRKKNKTREAIVSEFGDKTGHGDDISFGRLQRHQLESGSVIESYAQQQGYEVRQPINSGINTVNYLAFFNDLRKNYLLGDDSELRHKPTLEPFFNFYSDIKKLEGCHFLKDLFDSCLVLYISQFGEQCLDVAAKKLFRVTYSPRVSNQKAVKEASIPAFISNHPVLDWITMSYTPSMLFELCDGFTLDVDKSNLDSDKNSVKKRFVFAVLKILKTETLEQMDAENLAQHFQTKVDQKIIQELKGPVCGR